MADGASPAEAGTRFGAVAIGRDEGDRLVRCLKSLLQACKVVYVDSGSSDGSVAVARELGAEVVELEKNVPFTAARARNAGFHWLRGAVSDLEFVQFVDGDCELDREWPVVALSHLQEHSNVAVVCGRRRERYPMRTVYNWLCDREWDVPPGQSAAFGGDVMMRTAAFDQAGGYRDDLIAGEEPELAVRLRQNGWLIWRLPAEMTLHDAAMTRFSQWWRRMVRSGYAFAQGAHLHGMPPERHWVWESRRAWLWGVWFPLIFLLVTVLIWPWGALIWFVYPLQFIRQVKRTKGTWAERVVIAFFQIIARFPEGVGQIKFLRDRFCGKRIEIIEYK